MAEMQKGGWVYGLAVVLGAAAGWLDVKVSDLMLTAVVVMIFTMTLGVLRPRAPWRWMVLVGAGVPVARLMAGWFLAQHSSRAEIYESFLGFLTGTVGAYGGSLMRRALQMLNAEK